MRTRRREREDGRRPTRPEEPTTVGGGGRLRDAGERMLAAADEAIDRALSGDSAAFLAASRQEGGQ